MSESGKSDQNWIEAEAEQARQNLILRAEIVRLSLHIETLQCREEEFIKIIKSYQDHFSRMFDDEKRRLSL